MEIILLWEVLILKIQIGSSVYIYKLLGVVVYTGYDTKVMRNEEKGKNKMS